MPKLRSQALLISGLVVILDLIGARFALAQVRIATLDELRRELSRGDVISVVQTTGEVVEGRLVRFGNVDFDIRVETRQLPAQPRRLDITIPLSAIQSLDRPRDSSRNGALIGASIGGGSVLSMFAWALAVDRNEFDEWGSTYLGIGALFTGIGALAGWAIDSAHSKSHGRFDAPSAGTMKIRTAPQFSRGRRLSVAVSFK